MSPGAMTAVISKNLISNHIRQHTSRIKTLMNMTTLTITSEAFTADGNIPVQYTGDGDNVNPPLRIENIPKETKSLVLIVDDPDAPAGVWHHWVVWNIPPKETIDENEIPGTEGL